MHKKSIPHLKVCCPSLLRKRQIFSQFITLRLKIISMLPLFDVVPLMVPIKYKITALHCKFIQPTMKARAVTTRLYVFESNFSESTMIVMKLFKLNDSIPLLILP